MKSAIVELGAYAQPRAAPLLDAGTGPANPARHAGQIALAVRPADGLIRNWLAHGVRPSRRGNPVSHEPIPTRPIKLEASP